MGPYLSYFPGFETSEQFECRECFYIGALNLRGQCEKCGSNSGISQELVLAPDPLPVARSA
jgi:hypothetical protein